MPRTRLLLVLIAIIALVVPVLGSAFAAQQVTRKSAPSSSIGVTPIFAPALQVELEGQVGFVPADGTPHRAANIVIAEADFTYDFAADQPVLFSAGSFGPAAKCGTSPRAYGIDSDWVDGSDFHSNGPPLTKVGELTVTFPPDALPGCIGFGAVVSVTFTVIGPDEDD